MRKKEEKIKETDIKDKLIKEANEVIEELDKVFFL